LSLSKGDALRPPFDKLRAAQDSVLRQAQDSGLWIEAGVSVPDENVTIGPRVGLNTVPEPWFSMPWRFLVKGWKILESGE
jgi:3-methyladenine DNA glycosylase Mpg